MALRPHHDARYHLVSRDETTATVNGSDPTDSHLRDPPSPTAVSKKTAYAHWSQRPWFRLSLLLSCASIALWASPYPLHSLLPPLSPVPPPPAPVLPSGLPILARTISLILCEGQDDIDRYVPVLPSISADVVFYCWKDADCGYPTRSSTPHPDLSPVFIDPVPLLVSAWTSNPNGSVATHDGRLGNVHRHSSLLVTSPALLTSDSIDPTLAASLYPLHPSVWVLNEKSLGVKLTWTGSRNRLLAHVRALEAGQGWRWAFLTFNDGDVHMQCDPLRALLPVTPARIDEARVSGAFHYQWLQLLHTAQRLPLSVPHTDAGELACTVAYHAFLLTAAPARGTIVGVLSTRVAGVDAQVGYDMDAMLNSLQSAALPYLLPYCERFDSTGWWLSQILLNARAMCVFGHTLVMNDVQTREELQVHRDYPRIELDAMYTLFDQVKGEMGVYPAKYAVLEKGMQKKSAVFPALLKLYSGWWPDLLEAECRDTRINDTLSCHWRPPKAVMPAPAADTTPHLRVP